MEIVEVLPPFIPLRVVETMGAQHGVAEWRSTTAIPNFI